MQVEQLLQHLERIGAVAAAATGEAGGAELRVFGGIVRNAVDMVVSVRGGTEDRARLRTSGWCQGSRRRRRRAGS